ncbi:hypothetical protein LJR225_000518 [Phenylobacterium sp. LjRoot225]|uniref:hypothetical protein n=1 Tax=Phenylobacterium sp. LjRoot225 TaxID=3342285 RepID=UPI003ECD27DE
MRFAVGDTYTRKEVQDLLSVPEGKRNGQWQNGYPRYQGELFIFCNVGAPGRTGHDYPNAWDGDDLLWVGREGAELHQPVMQEIANNALPIHVFWRSENKQPRFTYHGLARTKAANASSPPQFRFGFEAPASLANATPRGETSTLRQLLGRDGRLFAKSEFGVVDGNWPALSFSVRKSAADLFEHYKPERDLVLVVGTSDPARTVIPEHRKHVLCAVRLEPRAPISTSQIVPEDAWAASVAKWGQKWDWSLPVTASYQFEPLLEARRHMPRTYEGLGHMANIGRWTFVHDEDLPTLLDARLFKLDLTLRPSVQKIVALNASTPDVRRALSQVALNIQQRIQLSGQERIGQHPVRKGPNLSDILAALTEKWDEQGGHCLLCGGRIPLSPKNRLLQISPDRIDSEAKTYDPANVHLTHLGCNLAKSSGTMEDWQEFLAVIRTQSAAGSSAEDADE